MSGFLIGPCGVAPAASGDAAQTTAFLARVVANGTTLDTTHINAYKAFINGLVLDNIISLFDGLWIIATQDLATARLNLISSSFPLVNNGGTDGTFTPDRGYKAGSSLQTQVTGFNPTTQSGSSQYQQNAAHLMGWQAVMGTRAADYLLATDVGGATRDTLYADNSSFFGDFNDSGGSLAIATETSGLGFRLISRDSSTVRTGYTALPSDTSLTNAGTANSKTTNGVPNANIHISDLNGSDWNDNQMSAASIGGPMNSTQAAAYYARMRTFMLAVGNAS